MLSLLHKTPTPFSVEPCGVWFSRTNSSRTPAMGREYFKWFETTRRVRMGWIFALEREFIPVAKYGEGIIKLFYNKLQPNQILSCAICIHRTTRMIQREPFRPFQMRITAHAMVFGGRIHNWKLLLVRKWIHRDYDFYKIKCCLSGETGWASEGETFNNAVNTIENEKRFWEGMRDWSSANRVKVQMFEAFDEPWKTGMEGEKHFGWWYRPNNNEARYIEKATGQVYQWF